MSNDSQRKDAMNNPYSKKSIDFVDLLRSIDRLFRSRRRERESKGHILHLLFVYYTADNQQCVILCLTYFMRSIVIQKCF